ncbi:MAG: hypothetical protein U1E65_11970 [Myxococcota bacterium]
MSSNAKWAEPAQPDDLRFGGAPVPPRSAGPSKARAESTIPVDAILRRKKPPTSIQPSIFEAAASEVSAAPSPSPAESSLARAVRRDESVIAEAARIRKNRMKRMVASSTGLDLVGNKLRALSDRLKAQIASLMDRIGALPTAQKRLLVAIPYGLALILIVVIVLLQVFQRPGAEEPLAATKIAPAAQALVIESPPPLAPVADPPVAAPSTPAAVAPIPGDLSPTEVLRRLPVKSALFAAPKKGAVKTAALPAGTSLITYPTIAAPEGWILARKLEGEVGYLRKKHLDAPPEPETAAAPAALPRRVEPRPVQASRSLEDRAVLTDGARAPAPEPKHSSLKKKETPLKDLSADDLLAPPKKRR